MSIIASLIKLTFFTCMLLYTQNSLCCAALVPKSHQPIICLIVLSFCLPFYSEHAPEVDREQHNSGTEVQLVDWWFDFGFFG